MAARINYRFHRAGTGDPIMLRIAHHDAAEVFVIIWRLMFVS